METKKSKPNRIEKKDQKDQYGNTSFVISFDNGDRGWYTSKNEDQTKFVVGVEVEYCIEEKEGKNNSKYFKVTVPQTENKFQSGGGFQKKQQDPKVQFISFSMSYTKDLIVAGKVPLADMEKEFNRMFNAMLSKL